jgi:Flagellar basal body-associated protein
MAEEKDTKEAKGGKGISLPVLLGIIVGVLVVQGGLLFWLLRPSGGSAGGQHPSAEPVQAESAAEVPTGVIVPVEDLVVNPRGSSSRYVLVALGLEVENAKYAEKVRQELMIPVRDRIMSVVSSYSIEELQANGARDSLRVRLRQELSSVLPGIRLRNVYFSKFVIQ